MNLTKSQLALFWRMFTAAVHEKGMPKLAHEVYRRQVLMELGGVEHLRDLDKTSGFDRVMARLAEDAGDYEAAIRYAGGGVRRYRALIERKATELLLAKGGLETDPGQLISGTVEAYITGILFQGRLVHTRLGEKAFAERLAAGSGWDDIPENVLRIVLQITNSELKKVRSR